MPAGGLSLLYYLMLGYRRDYLGHFAAGYGGTLSACAVVMVGLAWLRFADFSRISVFPCVMLCIGAGAVAEATVFRLAAFDPIDFCNQSIGAVFAGYAALHLAQDNRPSDARLWAAIGSGIGFLALGCYFALT